MSRARSEKITRILKMVGLTLIDALIYNEVLARIYVTIPSLSRIRATKPLKRSIERSWTLVLKENYEPIFEIALELITNFPTSPALEASLEILLDEAERIAASKVLLRHDLMGRIYHRLLLAEIAKYYATYYTSIPAANFLARLALDTVNDAWNIDWSNVEDISEFKVADFACGSGTLLSAIYSALFDKYIVECSSEEISIDSHELHTVLLEKILWGFDVLSFAAHLTVTTLGLHNPEAIFKSSNIYSLPLGLIRQTPTPEIRLGSIDLLKSDEINILRTLLDEEEIGAEKKGLDRVNIKELKVPSFKLVIMNPPFTRNVGGNLLFGDLPKTTRRILGKELNKIIKDKGYSGIGKAGLGAVFTVIGDKYLENGGRLALVCPRTLITGISWEKIRELLSNNYHVEYIISSFQAPNDWNFSENTNLSEILLVARKSESDEDSYTAFINLWEKPTNEMDSIILSKQCEKVFMSSSLAAFNLLENPNASFFDIKIGRKKKGEAYLVNSELLKTSTSTWEPFVSFAQSELNRFSYNYVTSGILNIPSKPNSEIIPVRRLGTITKSIGPDVSQVHSNFSKSVSLSSYRALWDHKSEYVKQLGMKSNMYLKPKSGKIKSADKIWNKGSGKLMLAERLWLNTHRLFTILLPERALSNMWWPVNLLDAKTQDGIEVSSDDHEKIQTLWLNSTLGIIGSLLYRQDVRGGWIQFKKGLLTNVPVLDISKLEHENVSNLLKIYSDVSKKTFDPLPEQLEKAVEKEGIRYELDDLILQIVNGNSVSLDPIYELLNREPFITIKPIV